MSGVQSFKKRISDGVPARAGSRRPEGQTARAACTVVIQSRAGFGFLLLAEGTASDCGVTIELNTRSPPPFSLQDVQGHHLGLWQQWCLMRGECGSPTGLCELSG